MGAIGEVGSAVRSRVRFQEVAASESESVDSSGSESGSVRSEGFVLNEDPSFWEDHNVQVVIRIRPLSNAEISLQGNNKCVRQDSSQTVTWVGHPETRFTFDLVADEHVTQEKLFKVAGVPMVENCVGGYNSCMFAYGQTGSGKTHTMLGDIEGGTRRNSVNCGMTPRVFEYMFSRIQKEKEARRDEKLRFICKCSFLEIYNEQILDLLDPSSANLQIREDAKKGVHVENLTEFEVSSARDVMQQLIQGSANRKVAATNMNRASSRSHSVFTCVMESKWETQGVTHHRFARLNLVDLAGSERQKSSGAEGERLKEATNINKSLSTLGLVIMNLVSSNKKSQHVPYRDSKLTFLLQDSLGGNSKTTIIANISPSNCCALETLSTLKFAQRAKFIRNNAIVNEDASGDVLAMRLQIQQLKKEVHHLQGLVNGGTENFRGDCLSAFTPGSPNTFKWEGVQGSFSPLTLDKRLSQRKEYEAALVAAFRRDQDKEATLKALTTGKQEAEQLATQRAEEARSLKMRLKFREEAIKRLQAVNSGKLSAETHLLQEKEELLKEIEVLRNQVDRNPEVTRFAMENLQLKEELRRLQSFVEEGERDMLNEQITILQDKLLEALDWKLMHEKDAEDRLSLTWGSSDNEENEFLRLQAIQNQREIDALRKNLTSCLEAKEKLERRVDVLVSQLKEPTSSNAPNENSHDAGSTGPMHSEANESPDDQMELKTMVEAIAAASQREAEAHETAITLAKENQELVEKIKVLFDDNNKLIELYEGAVASSASNQTDVALQIKHIEDSRENINHVNVDHLQHELNEIQEENDRLLGLYEKAMQEKDALRNLETRFNEMQEENDKLLGLYEEAMLGKDEIKNLQCQLNELHEENDRLLGLYEKAMQEKDALRNLETRFNEMQEENDKLLGLYEEAMLGKDEIKNLQCQLNELHEENDRLLGLYEKAMQEKDEVKKQISLYEFRGNEHKDYVECEKQNKEHSSGVIMSTEAEEEINCEEKLVQMDDEIVIGTQESENIKDQVRAKLELVDEQLAATAKAIQSFKLLEKATIEVNELRDAIESKEQNVNLKQQEIGSLTCILPKSLERTTITENKLSALKIALQNFSSRVEYWDKREEQARQRVSSCTIPLEQKKDELRHLRIRKDEADNACLKSRQAESELRNDVEHLKLKLQNADVQKKETERVLFAIDNKLDNSQRPVEFGKASDMLKSEEERSKIFEEMKQQKQRLVSVRKEIADSTKISEALDAMIQSLEGGIKNGMNLLNEAELKLQGIVAEKEVIFEMQETGRTTEMSKLLVEYQESIFESDLRKEEIKLCEESLQLEMRSLEELRLKYILATRKLTESEHTLSLSKSNDRSFSVLEKVEIELRDIQRCLVDVKLL